MSERRQRIDDLRAATDDLGAAILRAQTVYPRTAEIQRTLAAMDGHLSEIRKLDGRPSPTTTLDT